MQRFTRSCSGCPMPHNVPCVFCDGQFSWTIDPRKYEDSRLACDACSAKAAPNAPPVEKCRWCGGRDQCLFSGDQAPIARGLDTCFKCAHWIQILTQRDDMMIVTPEYGHYTAVYWGIRKSERDRWKGFGGSPWQATFLDGSVKTTNDLWFQGDIPAVWQSRFTPNVVGLRSLTIEERKAVACA